MNRIQTSGGYELATRTEQTWEDAVGAFLNVRPKSIHTKAAYERDLRHVFSAIDKQFLHEITPADLAQYAAKHLRPVNGNAPRASQARRMAALRSFLKWAARPSVGLWPYSRDHVDDSLEAAPAPVRKEYQVLTDAELARLIQDAPSPRARAAVALLAGTAVRVSELAMLDVADIQVEEDGSLTVFVISGKGGKSRTIPVSEGVRPLLIQHLEREGRSMRASGPVFQSWHGEPVNSSTLWRIITGAAKAAGILKRVSPHALRHTYAIRFLAGGGTVPELQLIMGHSSLAATMRYTKHQRIEELRRKVPGLPQVANA